MCLPLFIDPSSVPSLRQAGAVDTLLEMVAAPSELDTVR